MGCSSFPSAHLARHARALEGKAMNGRTHDLSLRMGSSLDATRGYCVPAIICSYSGASASLWIDLSRGQGWVLEAARKLEAIGSLPPGWDSYGGQSLQPRAKEITVRALRCLEAVDLPTPSVVLGSAGTVQLE